MKWLNACLLAVGLATVPVLGLAQSAQKQDMAQLLQQFPSASSFADKQALVHQLSEMHDPQVRATLTALLEGNLYTRNSDSRVFITAAPAEGQAADAANGQLQLTD